MSYLSLRDYGIIGNQGSAVLISRLGSIDWCCLPFFDSPSHFAGLLDENQGGSFQICPQGDFESEQKYIEKTTVLQTHFETPTGRGLLTDWMPICDEGAREPILYRHVEVLEGEITWVLSCSPRFGYGSEGAQAENHQGGIVFRGHEAGDLGFLKGSIPLHILSDARSAGATFKLSAGEIAQFSWIWGRHEPVTGFQSSEDTAEYWRSHAHDCAVAPTGDSCAFAGPWHDLVVRSGLSLKMMTAYFSGSITEAITTSLPSLTGGTRNWDYRYAWIRNGALALQALISLGYKDEAKAFFQWLADIVTRDGAEGLQCVYTLDGGKYLPERELTFLSGYAGSRPVRVGNLSARQFQLDIFGHVMLASAQYHEVFGNLPQGLWPRLVEITDYICQAWRRPDRGPWEVRSKPEHFVASKVMCWVALDQAIRLAKAMNQEIPPRWVSQRDILHQTVCDQGFDEHKRSFVRSFGDRELDASVLLIPLMGFLPFDDPRVQSTLDAVQLELSDGVLVHRSRPTDNSPESDGAHLLSSFWFVSCLALGGRIDEATDRLAELCSYATPLGLFGEQVNAHTGEPAGNFPSSAAHLALINASLYVGAARGRKHLGIPLIGKPTRYPKAA